MNGCRQTDDTMPPFFLAVLCSYQRSQTWFLFFFPFPSAVDHRDLSYTQKPDQRSIGGERKTPSSSSSRSRRRSCHRQRRRWTLRKQQKTLVYVYFFLPPLMFSFLLPLNCSVNFQKPLTRSPHPARSVHAEGQRSGVDIYPKRPGNAELVFKPNRVLPHHPHSSSLVTTNSQN